MFKLKNTFIAILLAGTCLSQSFALVLEPEPTRDAPEKAPTANYLRNCYFNDGTVSWKVNENSSIKTISYGKGEQALKILPTTSDADTIGVHQVLYNKNTGVLNVTAREVTAFTTLYATAKVDAAFIVTIWNTPVDSQNYIIGPKTFEAREIIKFNGKVNIDKDHYDVHKVSLKLNFMKPLFETEMAKISIDNIGLEKYNDYIHACGRHIRKGTEPFYMEAICFSNTYDRYIYGGEYTGYNFNLLTSKHHKPTEAFRKITGTGPEGINKNIVRFSFNANWFTDDVVNSAGKGEDGTHNVWSWLDSNINEARRAGVYLLLDMHCAPGYEWLSGKWVQGTNEHPAELATSTNWIWNDSNKKNKMVKIWKHIALKYKDEPFIAGYQILTEPILSSTNSANEWIGQDTSLAERCINAIRENDKKHMIMVDLINGTSKDGKLSYGSAVNQFTNLSNGESNVIRHRAFYSPFTFSHQYATWLHRGLMFDRNKWPNGNDLDTMPEILGKTMAFYGDKNFTAKVQTSNINQVGKFEWVESEEFPIDEVTDIRLGTVIASINGLMPTQTEALFDTIEIIEIDPYSNTKILRKRVVTDYYIDPYPESGVSPILDYRAYNPICSKDITLNGASTNSEGIDDYFVLDSYRDNMWREKYVLAIKSQNNTLEGSYFGWFSNNNRFIPKPGHTYKVRAKINVSDSRLLNNAKVEMHFFKDVDSQLVKRNKNYLRSYINSIANTAKTNDVPMAIFEFGAMWQCFEHDSLNGGNMGGAQWTDDMISVLRETGIHWAYWSYHNEFMGLYPTNDWDFYPKESDIITPLADILRTK